MLDIQCGPDVEPCVEQFFDVLPALGVAAFDGVAVGQFVQKQQFRASGQGGIKVEFLQISAVICDLPPGQNFEPVQQGCGFLASMGLGEADDHVHALGAQALSALQHGKRLSDPRRGTKEDLQAAFALPACNRQKGIRIRPSLVAGWLGHGTRTPSDQLTASRARLRRRTLTRGSPKTPSHLPSM